MTPREETPTSKGVTYTSLKVGQQLLCEILPFDLANFRREKSIPEGNKKAARRHAFNYTA